MQNKSKFLALSMLGSKLFDIPSYFMLLISDIKTSDGNFEVNLAAISRKGHVESASGKRTRTYSTETLKRISSVVPRQTGVAI